MEGRARRRLGAAASVVAVMGVVGVAVTYGRGPSPGPAVTATGADTMRVAFERTGGFGGLRLSVTIEDDTLSAEDADRLRDLIAGAGFFDLAPEILPDAPAPDDFEYHVQVEMDGRTHTVRTTDTAAPGGLRPLLDWLARAARRPPGG